MRWSGHEERGDTRCLSIHFEEVVRSNSYVCTLVPNIYEQEYDSLFLHAMQMGQVDLVVPISDGTDLNCNA